MSRYHQSDNRKSPAAQLLRVLCAGRIPPSTVDPQLCARSFHCCQIRQRRWRPRSLKVLLVEVGVLARSLAGCLGCFLGCQWSWGRSSSLTILMNYSIMKHASTRCKNKLRFLMTDELSSILGLKKKVHIHMRILLPKEFGHTKVLLQCGGRPRFHGSSIAYSWNGFCTKHGSLLHDGNLARKCCRESSRRCKGFYTS